METSLLAERSRRPHFGPVSHAHIKSQVRNLSKARSRILEYLVNGPCTVSSLAMRTGQHENTIREHLDALVDLELAIKYRSTESVRGRPAWMYHLQEDSRIGEYAGLASALAGAIARSSMHPVADAIEAGNAWAPELIRNLPTHAELDSLGRYQKKATAMRRRVVSLLERLGFEPQPNVDFTRVKLLQCPLLDAARQHPDIICSVHLGIVQGSLKEFGSETKNIRRVDLQPFSETGACLLRM